jgi:hypothetical protein
MKTRCASGLPIRRTVRVLRVNTPLADSPLGVYIGAAVGESHVRSGDNNSLIRLTTIF